MNLNHDLNTIALHHPRATVIQRDRLITHFVLHYYCGIWRNSRLYQSLHNRL